MRRGASCDFSGKIHLISNIKYEKPAPPIFRCFLLIYTVSHNSSRAASVNGNSHRSLVFNSVPCCISFLKLSLTMRFSRRPHWRLPSFGGCSCSRGRRILHLKPLHRGLGGDCLCSSGVGLGRQRADGTLQRRAGAERRRAARRRGLRRHGRHVLHLAEPCEEVFARGHNRHRPGVRERGYTLWGWHDWPDVRIEAWLSGGWWVIGRGASPPGTAAHIAAWARCSWLFPHGV